MYYLNKDGKTVLYAKERGGIYVLESILLVLSKDKKVLQAFVLRQHPLIGTPITSVVALATDIATPIIDDAVVEDNL